VNPELKKKGNHHLSKSFFAPKCNASLKVQKLMGKGSGFGKVILFGEHFVVHGVPGIVSAIDSTNDAEVKKATKGITVQDVRRVAKGYAEEKRLQQLESIDRILRAMGIEPRTMSFDILLGGSLPG